MSKYSIAFFHEFKRPPWGGSNTFTLALKKELEKWGVYILENRVTKDTRACLLNAYLFDPDKIAKIKRDYPGIKIVHRIDGPIGIYRGTDLDIDHKIHEMNTRLADATIFQSEYSLIKHREHGMVFKKPVIIQNASDPSIFNSKGKINYSSERRGKIFAASWSDGLKKGFALYKWLDTHLDWDKYEFTFVGRAPEKYKDYNFKHVRYIKAMSSGPLAREIKNHDVYLTASQDESCSNSLIEGLTCGLPAVYISSGGHPEIVKKGGVSFSGQDDVLVAINEVFQNYEKYRMQISVYSIQEIADKYLRVLLP